jgi:hypothetical protein
MRFPGRAGRVGSRLTQAAGWTALLALAAGSMSCTNERQPPSGTKTPNQRATAPAASSVPSSSDEAPPAAHPAGPAQSCALKLSGNPHGNMSVAIVVHNRTKEPLVLSYYHPLFFALEAWAGSKKLVVNVPAFDGPVEPRTVTVELDQRLEIPTPVTLRFAPDGKPKTDSPFEWLLLSPPTDVRLKATRVFKDLPDLSCELKAQFR